jgi:hypothetical protein
MASLRRLGKEKPRWSHVDNWRRRNRPATAGYTGGGARVPGSEMSVGNHKNQIELEEVVGLIEADESPISPALRRAGGGQEKSAARRRHGSVSVRVREVGRRRGQRVRERRVWV